MTTTTPTETELTQSISRWMDTTGITPPGTTPTAYMTHGYTRLAARLWPASRRLPLVARWMVWMWLADDVYDDELPGHAEQAVSFFTDQCKGAITGTAPHRHAHPLAHAAYVLRIATRDIVPERWWARYEADMLVWLDAARHNVIAYDRHRLTPPTAHYLAARHQDGGMNCAAAWVELGTGAFPPDDDHDNPRVRDLLTRFSNIGCWVNDLADDPGAYRAGTGRNLVAALVAGGEHPDGAVATVRALVDAELTVFRFTAGQITDGSAYHPDTRAWVAGLVAFVDALVTWTGSSSRYAHQGAGGRLPEPRRPG